MDGAEILSPSFLCGPEVLETPSPFVGGSVGNFEHNLELLEPLFSDYPSVDHKYTTWLDAAWGWAARASDYRFGYNLSAELCERGNVLIFWGAEGMDSNFSGRP